MRVYELAKQLDLPTSYVKSAAAQAGRPRCVSAAETLSDDIVARITAAAEGLSEESKDKIRQDDLAERIARSRREAAEDQASRMVSTNQAAELARVTPATIRAWVSRGKLKPVLTDKKGNWFDHLDVARAEQGTRKAARRDEYPSDLRDAKRALAQAVNHCLYLGMTDVREFVAFILNAAERPTDQE